MKKGFNSEIHDSQKVFRQVLDAMANPGTIKEIDSSLSCPEHLHTASGAISLTMLDFETPLWSDLDNGSESIQWIRFHTGAPYTYTKETASFALLADFDNLKDPQLFNQGSIESPHESTTLIVQTKKINKKKKFKLTGPGIKKEAFLNLSGIKNSFLDERNNMEKNYPLGIDMIFVCNRSFVAVPRTSKLEII